MSLPRAAPPDSYRGRRDEKLKLTFTNPGFSPEAKRMINNYEK